MANTFCSQLRQYVKQLVSNPQPCLVNQTAQLHVGDARNRFYSLLHSWSSEKPVELHRRQPGGSLPLVLTVNELKFVVLREDVGLPLQSGQGAASAGRQLNARHRGSPQPARFPETPRADSHQKESYGKSKPEKPNYANPEPEPSNKPNPELEASPRSKPDRNSTTQPRDGRPPAKPTAAYAPPMKFYVTKSPMTKMSESIDYTRRNFLGAPSRHLSSLALPSVTRGGLLEAVKSNQIKGYHATAANNKDRKDRDRDRNRDKEKERRREKDRVRSKYGDVEANREEERRADSGREGGRIICAGKRPDPPQQCPDGCRPSLRREPDRQHTSMSEPDSQRTSMSESDQCMDSPTDEADFWRGSPPSEPDSRRGASMKEPEWRKKRAVREPHSRRPVTPVEEPRSGAEASTRPRCSGNEPWKRECPGSNRLRRCPGGSCGRSDRDPERKSYSSYALGSRSNIPVLNHLRYSKSEVSRSIGGGHVVYAKKKGGCDDEYYSVKDKKKRMKLMEKELDEIKNCIDSVKCKFRKSPNDDRGSDEKS